MAEVIVSLLGRPGSGKSTAGRQVAEWLGWPYLSTGDIARKMAEYDPACYSALQGGHLAPEDEMRSRVAWMVGQMDRVIIDGMPRTADQVDFLRSLSPTVLFVEVYVPEREAWDRLFRRGRIDDSLEVIGNRLWLYNRRSEQIAKQIGPGALSVDGTAEVITVAHGLQAIIQDAWDNR